MLRYLAYTLISAVVTLTASFFLVNSGVLQGRIEGEARRITGLPVELGRVQVLPKWPLTFTVGATRAAAPDLSVEFRSAVITLATLLEPYDVRLRFDGPKVNLKAPLSDYSVQRTSPGGTNAENPSRPAAVGLALAIVDGEFRMPDLNLTHIDFDFAQRTWKKTPARVNLKARVHGGKIPGEIPFSVQTESLIFSEDSIKASNVKATFAGLSATIQVASLLKEERHRIVAEVQAPDLAKVPAPFELPASDWQGSIFLNAELIKEGPGKAWTADGRLKAQNVKAKIKWQQGAHRVEGPVAANLETKFAYVDGKITVPVLNGAIDLEMAQVDAASVLSKPPRVPLRLDVSGEGGADSIEFKKFEAKLWQLALKITGRVKTQAPYDGDLVFNLAPTPLKGLEAVILPLKNSLVAGELTLQGEIKGPLMDPLASQIQFKSLKLKNFSADVNYDAGGSVKARGPLAANIEARGEVDKGTPKSFQGSGQLQLGGLALVAGPLRKEAKQALAVQFSLRGDGQALQVDQMAVTGFLGSVKATGSVRDPLNPDLNVRIDMKPLDLSELRVAMPDFRDTFPKGQLQGRVNLFGKVMRADPWFKWPLQVTGEVAATVPEYQMVSDKAAPQPVAGTPPAAVETPIKAAEGFLPKGPLTEKLNMGVSATVGIFQKDSLTVKGIETNGRIAKGIFSGQAKVREVFGGQVQVTRLDVPLLDPQPTLQGQAGFQQIVVQDALEFVKPEYKTMATGRAAGSAEFSTVLPGDSKFMDSLKAKGQATFEPITLNTVKVGAMLNELISKVPVLKIPPAKVEPLKGTVKIDYGLESQAVAVNSLEAVDVGGSELQLKGKVALASLEGDLVGNFLWVNPQVKGCALEGNADQKGRLIIPLQIRGSLMQPQVSMLTDTVGKLAGRAIECEKKKVLDQMKKDGGEKLKNEAQKVLKGILGQ